jgi:multicomponent Na+:H+ antiporter subunit G
VSAVVHGLAWALIVAGALASVVGGLGLLRLPDFYCRVHAAGVTDTLGAMLILFGLALDAGWSQTTIKLLFMVLLISFTSPTSAHALVKAAYSRGVKVSPAEEPDGPRA